MHQVRPERGAGAPRHGESTTSGLGPKAERKLRLSTTDLLNEARAGRIARSSRGVVVFRLRHATTKPASGHGPASERRRSTTRLEESTDGIRRSNCEHNHRQRHFFGRRWYLLGFRLAIAMRAQGVSLRCQVSRSATTSGQHGAEKIRPRDLEANCTCHDAIRYPQPTGTCATTMVSATACLPPLVWRCVCQVTCPLVNVIAHLSHKEGKPNFRARFLAARVAVGPHSSHGLPLGRA